MNGAVTLMLNRINSRLWHIVVHCVYVRWMRKYNCATYSLRIVWVCVHLLAVAYQLWHAEFR